MSEKEEMLKRKREEEARARRILEEDLANDGKPRVPRKSKFVSDCAFERLLRNVCKSLKGVSIFICVDACVMLSV